MSDDGKIIVDDDWKSQAQREKAELSEKLDNQPDPQEREIPEASLLLHFEGLVVQTMMMLGLMEYPGMEGQRVYDPLQAKHLIDMLVVLRDKTAGNRTPEEEDYLARVVPELQLTWVEVTKAVAQQQAQGGAAAAGGPSIFTE